MNLHYQQREKSGETAAINFIPNRFSSQLSTSCTNAPRSLSRVKAGTHSPLLKGSHTTAHTAKHGAFRMGALLLPSERSTRFENPAWPGLKTANFAPFGSQSRVLPKNAKSLRDSDALMRVAVPRRRGPLGCVIFLQFGDVAVFSLCAQYFLNVRGKGVLLPSACFTCC